MPAYDSVVFIQDESDFVLTTMISISQNQAVGNTSDAGSVAPFSLGERGIALSIISKVRAQRIDPNKAPISFTQQEAKFMQYFYNQYIQVHGKPQGDIDWTYYIKLNDTSTQLVVNIINKLGGHIANFPSNTYPQSYNPYVRL